MAFLMLMLILNLYSDLCNGQNSMGDEDDAALNPRTGMGSTGGSTGFKCTKCIIGAKARESICSDCSRDDSDKPIKCRRCNIGTSAQPFICRSCTNSNPDISSCDCDGLTTATTAKRNDIDYGIKKEEENDIDYGIKISKQKGNDIDYGIKKEEENDID